MKIIHCADIHLDSKLEANLPTTKSRERKKEVILSFLKMIDYAEQNDVTAVIIAGDLFDSNRMLPTTANVILGKIAQCKNTDFLYLCGNHDAGKALSELELPTNLKLFDDSWVKYDYGNVTIHGVELTKDNCRHIYGSLFLDAETFNIVTMHGQLSSSSGEDMVNRTELSEKGINYLALGHYHKFDTGTLGKDGVWCYCGCLEGRGFDECGEKGFVVLDIDENGKYSMDFVKMSSRELYEIECDISGVTNTAEILEINDSKTKGIDSSSLIKLVLKGDISQDTQKDVELFNTHLNDKFWFAKVNDKTRLEIRYEEYINDISLKGEFIRQAMALDLDDEVRDRIIECGLRALSGQEVL